MLSSVYLLKVKCLKGGNLFGAKIKKSCFLLKNIFIRHHKVGREAYRYWCMQVCDTRCIEKFWNFWSRLWRSQKCVLHIHSPWLYPNLQYWEMNKINIEKRCLLNQFRLRSFPLKSWTNFGNCYQWRNFGEVMGFRM